MKKVFSYGFFTILIVLSLIISNIDFNLLNIHSYIPLETPESHTYMQRAYPGAYIPEYSYFKALDFAKEKRKKSGSKDEDWVLAGPQNIGGRITDIEIANEKIYIAAASGGIFVSDNEGLSWTAIFDNETTLAIGDIAIAPSNPDVIYAGTGEANPGGGSETYFGNGIYRSNDGGINWNHIGLDHSFFIGKILVHPSDENTLYVAAMGKLYGTNPDRGVYKTTDGGQSWEQILYVSDSTGAIDLVMNPNNPQELYAAMWQRVRHPNIRNYGGQTSGIYKTTDSGQTWEELSNGLPANPDDKGRIGLAISQQNPATLFAIYADRIGYLKGIYKSSDNGSSWTSLDTYYINDMYSSYGWWFGHIWVSPENQNLLFTGGLPLYKSTNGGNSWIQSTGWNTHVDQHAMYFDTENNKIYLGNDGGLFVSTDNGNSWTKFNNLPITQFYTCHNSGLYEPMFYGGAQDNGTLKGNSNDWEAIYGGDGFVVLTRPDNPDVIYAEYQYGNLVKSTNGGLSFEDATYGIGYTDRKNWEMPVVFDPNNPDIMYCGTQKLYRSTDGADSWTAISEDLTDGEGAGNLVFHTITSIAVSPFDPNLIFVGTDDGNLHYTDNLGTSWNDISEGLPKRWVTSIINDIESENMIYVSLSGYRYDDNTAHIFKSADNGNTWTDFSEGMPDIPVNDLLMLPIPLKGDGAFFAATDIGIFQKNGASSPWTYSESNLPVVVNDLYFFNEKVSIATFGRSMYYFPYLLSNTNSNAIDPLALNIFPNPVRQNLHIKLNYLKPQRIVAQLLDINGKILQNLYTGMSENIPVLNLSPTKAGTYFIKIRLPDTGRYIIRKIVKI